MTCGKPAKPLFDFKRLAALGNALELQQSLSAFDGGFIGFGHETETKVSNYDKREARRSAAQSRQGQRTAERPWRASGEAHHFSSEAVERAFGTEFRILAQHYDALAFEDDDGLWVAATSKPLGRCGPQIHFLIAFNFDRAKYPRAWAFEAIGQQVRPMLLKHTNFPDASLCAFLPDEGAWNPEDGMVALIDHFSIWAVKSLHRQYLGRWPGKQFGACALYRRKEFMPDEQCGCLSGKLYKECHQALDFLVEKVAGEQEFRRLFRCDYSDRKVPIPIMQAAKTRWKQLPSVKDVFGVR